MKKLFIPTLFFLLSVKGFAQDTKVNWLKIEEAVALNKQNPKPFLIDVYTDWCGWCKRLDATTLKDKAVGDFFNENFINVHMEMEKSKEGPRLAKKMSIRGYPALFFINGKEEVKHFVAGYVKSDRLINEGSTALKKK